MPPPICISAGCRPQSAAEAQVMVAKIIAYETEPNTKTWEKNTLLVADDQEEAFESVFKTMNEDAAALLPTAMDPPYKGYLQDYLDAGFSPLDLNSDIVDQDQCRGFDRQFQRSWTFAGLGR